VNVQTHRVTIIR